MGDETWRSLPKLMSQRTQEILAEQLAGLADRQGRPFSIVLHGGEPLLLGELRLSTLFTALRQKLGSEFGISVQTNGVLITDKIIDVLEKYGIRVSISLDGPPTLHDTRRPDLRGRPTHARVLQGISKLLARPASVSLFSGLLAVVDPYSDPDNVYRFFKEVGAPSVDFLYRDGNHSKLPYGKDSVDSDIYGRWMAKILDLYIADPQPMRIRILDDIIKLLLGGAGMKEGIGLTDFGILVIDTDGSIRKNDTLKSSPLGDTFNANWNLNNCSLSDIATSDEFRTYHIAQKPSSAICANCSLLRVCGGGMVTHRFKEGRGYENPTVFCADQKFLIERVFRHLSRYNLVEARVA